MKLLARKPLYIETLIACDLDTLWRHTQEPQVHEQWDLRFSSISYLPKTQPGEPQRFHYSTKIGFGISVNGLGQSVATKLKDNGEATSVLKFSSASPLSIIRQGSGYWKYSPLNNKVRFYTGYDYETRWGLMGRLADKLVFRPLMVWATAWSFDCLKNWIERGIDPRQALLSFKTIVLASLALSSIWLYQGLVPKLLFTDTGELEILKASGLFPGHEQLVLTAVGIAEIVWAAVVLVFPTRLVHRLNMAALLLLAAGAVFSDVAVFAAPFNPFSLTVGMVALSLIIMSNLRYVPRASNCITNPR